MFKTSILFLSLLLLSVLSAPPPSPSSLDLFPKLSQTNTFNPFACTTARTRKEVRDLTPLERTQWQQAIQTLRSQINPDNGLSIWDILVSIHASFLAEAHGGSYFLPWHRYFLLILENALRTVEPNLALPYWDWSQDAADAALSPVWGADLAGGARTGFAITSGAFLNLEGRVPNTHFVGRTFDSGVSGEMGALHNTSVLDLVLAVSEWGDFANALEVCHNIVHNEIGGDMQSTPTAPNDPVFYLHHAFVDYVWARRQSGGGLNEFGGTHTFGFSTVTATSNFVMQAFERDVESAFDLGCVNYQAPSFANRRSAPRDRSGGEKPRSPCEDEAIKAGIALDMKRCKEGEKVLEGLS